MTNTLAYSSEKMVYNVVTSVMYYENIMTNLSDDRKWSLYFKSIKALAFAIALALACVINYNCK